MTAAHEIGHVPDIALKWRLQIARDLIEMDQAQFAKHLGLGVATIKRAETGRGVPKRATLMAWSLATGVSLHWLETGHAPSPDGDGACQMCAIRDSNPEPAD